MFPFCFPTVRVPAPVAPDDDGALMLNATGVLEPETSWVSVALRYAETAGRDLLPFDMKPTIRRQKKHKPEEMCCHTQPTDTSGDN